jgi:glycosyltransferase involved in cell wall biosynthesis
MTPAVSIIMPCRNGGAHVARGVASVLAQSFADWELIFVDDGSTDGSADRAASFKDPRVRILRVAHGGVSAARNIGIAEARGRMIAFLDVDDTWDADFLQSLTKALDLQPECALAYCGWQNLGLSGGRGEPYVPPLLDGIAHPEALLASCPWPIHAALTRTDVIRARAGFDTRLVVGEDFLFWLEIACFLPIVRVPAVLAFYHHHGAGQASRQSLRAALQPLAAQETFLARHPLIAKRLGRRRVRELTFGTLLKRGYESYWKGDLDTARAIFRRVLRSGYGRPRDWTYMLPSLLPTSLHRQAVGVMRALRS